MPSHLEFAIEAAIPTFVKQVKALSGAMLFIEVRPHFDFNPRRKFQYWASTDPYMGGFRVGLFLGHDDDRLKIKEFSGFVGYGLGATINAEFDAANLNALLQSGIIDDFVDSFKLATAARVAICELIEWADNAQRGIIVQETS